MELMRTTILGACLTLAASCSAMAQTAGEPLSFEVASIKPAAPMQPGRMMMGSKGGPGSADPGHLTYTNLSVKNMLVNAFGVKPYQISGPAWLDTERFDVVAKVPQGATKEQVKVMLQNLLKDRFKLEVHHEAKDMPMYALVVGKNGPKMKESPPDDPASAATGTTGPNPNDDVPTKLAAPVKITMGPDGMPQFPAGMAPKKGCMQMMMGTPSGMKAHMVCTKQTMQALVVQLSNQMDKPVSDLTGLTANYDFTLDFAPDENRMMAMMPAGGAAVAFTRDVSGPGPGPGPGGPYANNNEPPAVPPLAAAVQEQLGLKLEQKKGPVDLIVVDKMEKVPTDN